MTKFIIFSTLKTARIFLFILKTGVISTLKIKPFALERYFAKYEFKTDYVLCASDCQGLTVSWLMEHADIQCKTLWDNLTLGYTESLGHPILREEIAQLYESVDPSEVLVVSGPEEGIFITLNALLKPKDHTITTWPSYQSLYEIPMAIGCEVDIWPLQEHKGWSPSLPSLNNSMTDKTKVVIINFPHNPTGFLPDKKLFTDIVNICKEFNSYLLSDEVYRFLEYKTEDRLPSAVEAYDKSIVISGMSKAFALAGLRIGWVITKDKELFKKIAEFKNYTTICNSAPSEILAITALRLKDEIIQRNIKIILKNFKIFEQSIENDSEFKYLFSWVPPKAGSVFFPSIRTELAATVFCNNLRKEEGVLLLPGKQFHYEDKNFRIGLGRTDFEVGMEKLIKYLNKHWHDFYI